MTVVIYFNGNLYADRVGTRANAPFVVSSKIVRNTTLVWGAAGTSPSPAMLRATTLEELAAAFQVEKHLRDHAEVLCYERKTGHMWYGCVYSTRDERLFSWSLAEEGVAIGSYGTEWLCSKRADPNPYVFIRAIHTLWGIEAEAEAQFLPRD